MIVIVGCGKKKSNRKCRADSMYQGSFHKALLKYARILTAEGNIFILSAKYGFLRLSDMIEPYELKMRDKGAITVNLLNIQANRLGIKNQGVIILAGKDYAKICGKIFPSIRTPLSKIGGIGKQMKFLKEKNNEN